MKTIKLKLDDRFFFPVALGTKTFEIRKMDEKLATVKIGDRFELYRTKHGKIDGDCVRVRVSYIFAEEDYGVKKGYVIFGIKNPSELLFKPEVIDGKNLH